MVPTEPHLMITDFLCIWWRTPYWTQFRKMWPSLPVQSVGSQGNMPAGMIRTVRNRSPWRMTPAVNKALALPVPNCHVQLNQTPWWGSNSSVSQTIHWPKCTRKERRQNKPKQNTAPGPVRTAKVAQPACRSPVHFLSRIPKADSQSPQLKIPLKPSGPIK